MIFQLLKKMETKSALKAKKIKNVLEEDKKMYLNNQNNNI